MKENMQKFKWYAALFLAVSLFLTAMLTGNLLYNLAAIGLAIVIYKYGNPVLFKEYDARKKEKLAQSQLIRDAAEQTLQSGKLFKKMEE